MERQLQQQLTLQLSLRKERLETLASRARELRRRAANLDRIYGQRQHGKSIGYQMEADALLSIREKELKLIQEALSDLKRGNPQKAQEVLTREPPQ